jgi:putative flippase GtrA
MTSSSTRSKLELQAVMRFLLVGGANTVLSYGIFIGLGLILPNWLAYTIAYLAGLAVTTFATSRWVFRARLTLTKTVSYVAWYLLLFGFGQLIIAIVHPRGFLQLAVTSILLIALTTPLSYLGGRFIFKEKA